MDADAGRTISELKQLRSQRSSHPAENKLRRDEVLTMMVMIGFLMIPRINHKKLILHHRGSAVVPRPGRRDSRARQSPLLQLNTSRVKFQGLIH